jgi:hypothetical protein
MSIRVQQFQLLSVLKHGPIKLNTINNTYTFLIEYPVKYSNGKFKIDDVIWGESGNELDTLFINIIIKLFINGNFTSQCTVVI